MENAEQRGVGTFHAARIRRRAVAERGPARSTQAIVNSVAEFTAHTLPASHVFVSELTDSGRAFRLRAAVGFDRETAAFNHGRVNVEVADTMSCLARDVCVVRRRDKVLGQRISGLFGGMMNLSGASVPIRRGNGAWGVVGAYSNTGRDFDKTQILLLKAVSSHLEHVLKQDDPVEASILAAKRDWETTVDSLPQIVIVLDEKGRVIRANRILESWGYGAVGQVRGQPVTRLLKRMITDADAQVVSGWSMIRRRLAAERLVEWEAEQRWGRRCLRFSLRAIVAGGVKAENPSDCFAVLIIDDVTHMSAMRDTEKQLHVLSCQLIDAQETERKRIAAELHDGIGQIMGAIKFQVEGLIACGARRRAGNELGKVVDAVRDAMDEVRKIAMDLRPSTLDDLGLILTIDWFCREFCNTYTGIRIDKTISVEESAVIEERKIVIYRIMQEALNNIAKYADAKIVNLELSERDGGLYLGIQDNGRGFDIDSLPRASCLQGFGLRSMRERAELSGGVFSIHSRPGQGTRVEVRWPRSRGGFGLLGD